MKPKHRIVLIRRKPHAILKTFSLTTAHRVKAQQYANILSKLNGQEFRKLGAWQTRKLGKKVISVRQSAVDPNYEIHVIPG